MKNRLQKLILSLLIAVMCTNCALPVFAATEIADKEGQSFKEGIVSSKNSFFQLYSRLWKMHNLDKELTAAVNQGVNEKMSSMTRGTRGIRTLLFKKVAEESQELAIKYFTPHYEDFIYELEECFGKENNRLIAKFFRAITDEEIYKRHNNKAVTNYIKYTTNEILDKDAEKLHQRIEMSLRSKGFWAVAEVGGALGGVAVMGLGLSLISQVCRDKFTKYFSGALFKALGKKVTSAQRLAGGVGFVAGLTFAGWQGYKALGAIKEAPEDLKKQLNAGMSEQLKKQLPVDYWNVMEDDIRAMFNEAYVTFCDEVGEAETFANRPEVKALVGSASEGQ